MVIFKKKYKVKYNNIVLISRFITSLILIPLVLIIVKCSNYYFFIFILFLLSIICSVEWMYLIPISTTWKRLIFIIVMLFCIWILIFNIFKYCLLLILLIWITLLCFIGIFPRLKFIWSSKFMVFLFGLIVLTSFFGSLAEIYKYKHGKCLMINLFFLVWVSDIGAYFFGKQYGKILIASKISKGKTIEGFLGGGFCVLFCGFLEHRLFHVMDNIYYWMIVVFIVLVMSLFGDLFISMLKRRVFLKDISGFLPGHGGFLDRLDSLFASTFFFI
ncbi:phosphatidate cytidylyltransferase [Candidatus Legionella polyplacis]|uniref:Phosphatidate cytidylyltransferase n=1 Tax=Candidatus Legionella polyplacis TaxID=2005262 RepID=A0ABZ2GXR3_9GAMM